MRSAATSEPDPRIQFFIELIGYEKGKSGKPNPDWYEAKVGVEIFNTRVERPDPHLSKWDVVSLTKWLRQLIIANAPIRPFKPCEPMFTISAEPDVSYSGSRYFIVNVLIQAWNTIEQFFSEAEGLAVILPTSETSILSFAGELEAEMTKLGRQ